MTDIVIISIVIGTFVFGLIVGCFGTMLCIRFAVKAATEIRKGNKGLFIEKDNADNELDIAEEADSKSNNK